MSIILKSQNNGSQSSAQKGMANLPSLSSWVDDVFENGLGTGFLSNFNTGMSLPAVNIKEDADNFVLELAVPGMKKSDFDIDVDNKILSISSEVKTEDQTREDNYTRREFGYSSFKRTFTLPDTVNSEKINAAYNDGILRLNLPKLEEAKDKPSRRIEIA